MITPEAPSLLRGLNTEQLTAVTWPPQSALVLAGAGSGKTRVLTTRIAWLIANNMADVHSILAVTFTNKAAKEMHERLSVMLNMNLRPMWIGTFHGLCHRFLRLHHKAAQLPHDFQIIDTADQLAFIKRLLKTWQISEEILPPRLLQHFINSHKEAGLRAPQLTAAHPKEAQMCDCFAEYDRLCQRDGLVDFAELMLRCYEVLQSNDALREHYQNRFAHILVDEFQDTNSLQYRWLKLLSSPTTAVFAVGDDDQSIYRFRGADVGNMQAFLREFDIGEPIKLEQNYRSVGNILTAANTLIGHNPDRLGKNLRTDAGDGDKIRFYAASSDEQEAQFVIEEIHALRREGRALDECAILYRNNAQSRVLEKKLVENGLPYRIYGGLRFFERQEIKHALAYLRLAVNPDDDNALLRIINVPARGIGARTVENLQSAAAEQGISLFQAACAAAVRHAKTAAFVRLIDGLRQQINHMHLADIVHACVHESGLYQDYREQKNSAQDRLDNLDELIRAAGEFRAEGLPEELLPANIADNALFPAIAFLSAAALEAGETQAKNGESAVQLMTVHAAKGLEFDVVFLTGLEEGRFPSELSLQEIGGLEEERRLMYVAITRARQRLYISMAQERFLNGRFHSLPPSRFLDELPHDVLHRLSPTPSSNRLPEAKRLSSQSSMAAAPRDFHGFQLGQNVRHAKFGVGVIIDALDKGQSARLTINFGKQGIRELDTQFAPLEKM